MLSISIEASTPTPLSRNFVSSPQAKALSILARVPLPIPSESAIKKLCSLIFITECVSPETFSPLFMAYATPKAASSAPAQRTARPGVTVSAALGELLSRSGQIESRYREDRRTLQTGEAVLSKVRDALGRMAELAEKAAGDGDIDRDALQAGLERLTDEVERMLTGAFAGKTPLFLDEGAEPGGGVEALLRAVFSEASAGTEAARSLPEWLVRGLTAGELTPERIREAARAVKPDTIYFLKGKEAQA